MRRVPCFVLLTLLTLCRPAQAIQLHWAGGSTDLAINQSTQAVLVIQADSAATLPSSWVLQWDADSSAIQFVALDSVLACLADTAKVDSIWGPVTPADSAAHEITAHFCSAGSGSAGIAYYLLDLVGGSKGKLKVVALNPADTTQVIESNEVTYNGGVEGDYQPVILRTSTVHHSTEYLLTADGSGLAGTRSLTLVAPDGSWIQPLTIIAASESVISATAPLAAHVPACILRAEDAVSRLTISDVASDPPPPDLAVADTGGCERRFEEVLDPLDPYMIQPKDFAFVTGGWTPAGSWTFHLFYIRHNQRIASDLTEKNIGHQVSNDLIGWDWPRSQAQDTMAIRTRGGRFDSLHVWAPTVVLKGLTYFMLYTGVDKNHNQRIGLATSTDLVNWTQGDSVLEVVAGSPRNVPWADPAPGGPYSGQVQLRDPFIMPDPDVPGDWLMYFATIPQQYTPEMVIGVAKSHGDFTSWGSSFPLWNTHHSWINPIYHTPFVAESPHAFYRNGTWWLFNTVNNDSVWAVSNLYSPTDTVSSGTLWTPTQKLWTLVPPAQSGWFYYWHASEYLLIPGANDIEYLAAYTDDIVGIGYTQMRPATSPYLFNMDCPTATGVAPTTVTVTRPELLMMGARPARSGLTLRVELPRRMKVHLAIYDVLGRRVQTLVDGDLPQGASDLPWNGRDTSHGAVRSGIYFASLTTIEGRYTVRIPLVR